MKRAHFFDFAAGEFDLEKHVVAQPILARTGVLSRAVEKRIERQAGPAAFVLFFRAVQIFQRIDSGAFFQIVLDLVKNGFAQLRLPVEVRIAPRKIRKGTVVEVNLRTDLCAGNGKRRGGGVGDAFAQRDVIGDVRVRRFLPMDDEPADALPILPGNLLENLPGSALEDGEIHGPRLYNPRMVSTPLELWERYGKALLRLVQNNAALSRELSAARAEFFAGDFSDPGPAAMRRFEEWFLFERATKSRQETPAFTFHEQAIEELPAKNREAAEKFPEAIFGAFEVEEELDGAWSFQDLLSQRECTVRGPFPASAGARPTKNFVGRLFPWEDEFFVSPVCARFVPDGDFWEALRADLGRAKLEHAGSRIAQTTLEPLLWIRRAPAQPGAHGLALEELQTRWQELCAEFPQFDFPKIRSILAAPDSRGNPSAAILESMAFETNLDLDRARVLLMQIKQALAIPQERSSAKSCPCESGKAYDECCRAADALKAFDRGKARGEDLDSLFRKLEDDMGLDHDEEEDPGVVPTDPELTPLAEEFLWETQSAGGDELRAMFRHFEQESDPSVAHLEEITPQALRRYLSLILPMSEAGRDPVQGTQLLETIRRFGLWADMEQGTNLAAITDALCAEFQKELPRIARCNAALRAQANSSPSRLDAWEVQAAPSAQGLVQVQSVRDRSPRHAALPPEVASWIQSGDIVLATFPPAINGSGKSGIVHAVFPAQAKAFLE